MEVSKQARQIVFSLYCTHHQVGVILAGVVSSLGAVVTTTATPHKRNKGGVDAQSEGALFFDDGDHDQGEG